MATYPIAILFLGQEAALFGFVPAFMMSSFAGALLGYGLLKIMVRNRAFGGMLYQNAG
ncbi:MAG: energy coupling factor transporter S component ThiW [Solibacillus sp.]